MQLSGLIMVFGFAAFAYLILAAQVHACFPSSYLETRDNFFKNIIKTQDTGERQLRLMFPVLPGLLATMVLWAATGLQFFSLVLGILSAWGGLRLRQVLRRTARAPVPQMLGP